MGDGLFGFSAVKMVSMAFIRWCYLHLSFLCLFMVWSGLGGIAIIDSGRLVGGGHCRIFKLCVFVIGGEFYIFWEGRGEHGMRWGGWDC